MSNETENDISIDDIENLLNNEIKYNKNERWNKLDKTEKYNKLIIFANEYKHDEDKEDLNSILKEVLINGLNNNKFSKISDVNYDSNIGKILSIPSLVYTNNEYILRYNKRQSTSKSLLRTGIKTKRNKENNI